MPGWNHSLNSRWCWAIVLLLTANYLIIYYAIKIGNQQRFSTRQVGYGALHDGKGLHIFSSVDDPSTRTVFIINPANSIQETLITKGLKTSASKAYGGKQDVKKLENAGSQAQKTRKSPSSSEAIKNRQGKNMTTVRSKNDGNQKQSPSAVNSKKKDVKAKDSVRSNKRYEIKQSKVDNGKNTAKLTKLTKQAPKSASGERQSSKMTNRGSKSSEPSLKIKAKEKKRISTLDRPNKAAKHSRVILAWTKLTVSKPLWNIKPYSFRHCPFDNCEITSNRSRLEEADLLLFRIRELKSKPNGSIHRPYVRYLDRSDLPSHHPHGQIWMEVNQESPIYSHADDELEPLNNIFNLSVNYLLDSDFPLSYIPSVKPRVKALETDVDYSKGKTKMALWFVSHCNASSGRDNYVQKLMQNGIKVDVFGKCSGKLDGCARGNITCSKELRMKYKFYLAFENSICKEYITEKFWNTLKSDSYNIPIALGASMNEYERFAPPNSYLHTRNFTTVKHLAEFMKKLDSDNKAFNSYHKWRETHWIEPRSDGESLPCYMCRQANEKKDGNMKYKTLSSYWSRRSNCETLPEPVK